MKLLVDSRQMLCLFIELKFCMTNIHFLNKQKKCNMFVYKFASVYKCGKMSVRVEKMKNSRHLLAKKSYFLKNIANGN